MTLAVKSLMVLNWLDALKGPVLVEHVQRVYAKELDTCTLASLQTRLWKNMGFLLRECKTEEEFKKAYRAQARKDHDPAFFGQVGLPKGGGYSASHQRQGQFKPEMTRRRLLLKLKELKVGTNTHKALH